MLYNGTSCGLKSDISAPHFCLPIVQHTLCDLLPGYSQCDMVMGEMFLNFILHPDLILYEGVEVTNINIRTDEEVWDQYRTIVWELWAKTFMVITDPPYISLKILTHVKFIAYGDRNGPLRPFQWLHAKLILPEDESYTKKLPWVMKVRSYGNLATRVFIFVDDGPIISHSELVYWQAANRFCSICNSLGIQYASRKRTEPSLATGIWSGMERIPRAMKWWSP